jgi:hypothetical protein
MLTDKDDARVGWYYDPLHHQPVYLFWDQGCWRARFVWQDPGTERPIGYGGRLSGHDEELTHTMYERFIPLGQAGVQDYTSVGGSALRGLFGIRASVHVKPAVGGDVVFFQEPIADDSGLFYPLCQAVWLSDDEIPTVIRALQARRRAVLAGLSDAGETPPERDD